MDCTFHRIQFTPDLLPADITGINIYNRQSDAFGLRKGPVFCGILLADEINRATPRTQSALLECMGEGHVSIDGVTHPLDQPFFVIATENPVESKGTFPLPEAQLDRFMIRISLGYPDNTAEEDMVKKYLNDFSAPVDELAPVCTGEDIMHLRHTIRQVAVSPKVISYAVSITDATRNDTALRLGASPRGTLFLLRMAQALSFMDGRDYVLPDDIKKAAVPVLAHRVLPSAQNRLKLSRSTPEIIERIVSSVPSPVD